jgi:hypothetical protein
MACVPETGLVLFGGCCSGCATPLVADGFGAVPQSEWNYSTKFPPALTELPPVVRMSFDNTDRRIWQIWGPLTVGAELPFPCVWYDYTLSMEIATGHGASLYYHASTSNDRGPLAGVNQLRPSVTGRFCADRSCWRFQLELEWEKLRPAASPLVTLSISVSPNQTLAP